MNQAIVSVIIPAYNHGRFLRAALDSVLKQSFTQWEAVVINNFSEDDTVAVCASFNDPRIRLVNFANHGIIAASRNQGIALTTAPYLAFLDADDIWYPQKLATCMDKLAQGYDLVCHAEVWVGPAGRRRTVAYGPESNATYQKLLYRGNCISTSAVVVKRALVERAGAFDETPQFITAEDYDLWLKLARNGARIGFVRDVVLGEYLIHDGNQSRTTLTNMQAVLAVFEQHQALLGKTSTQGLCAKRRKAVIYYGGARGLQSSGQLGQAWSYFCKAVRQYPLVPRFYVAMLQNLWLYVKRLGTCPSS